MADDLLRSLERRVASGDPEAVAAHLRQRVRAGDLTYPMLELAAFLGHPPARLVLAGQVPDQPEPEPIRIAGVHAMAVQSDGPETGRSFCNQRVTKSERDSARQGHPTCRRCLGSSRWREHQRTAVTRWTELVIASYGPQAGRRVAIATVRAVVSWCQKQQRSTMPSIPFDLFENPRGGGGLASVEEELKQLQRSLELAEAPDDPAYEAKRIVRIVDGATLMGWSELREQIRCAVVPWALGTEESNHGAA